MADALITAQILERMLKLHDSAALQNFTSQPALLTKVTVGKYKGKLWSEMDAGYLKWVLDAKEPSFNDDVRFTAKHWLAKKEEKNAKDKNHGNQRSGKASV